MKLSHIYLIFILLLLAAFALGAIQTTSPLVQYLANVAGVLLGYVLGVGWQEEEKKRVKADRINSFWNEFNSFFPVLEQRIAYLKNSTGSIIFDSIIESRLPLIEANYLLKQARELELDSEFRRKFSNLVSEMRIMDEYIDFGAEKLNKWLGNFNSRKGSLCTLVSEMKQQYLK